MLAPRPSTPVGFAPTSAGFTWEETACLLCGREDSEVLCEAADPLPADRPGLRFAVVRCRHCGLAYTNPRPTPGTIGTFYPDSYPPHRPQRAATPTAIPSRFWSWVFGRPCRERRGALPGTGRRLLDFGCGSGGYLRRMAALGWRATGVDVSERVVAAVREEANCDAVAGSLPHPDLVPGSFDVVTMWQSLEHVHEPLTILREVSRLLVPGGSVVVSVPNFGSFSARYFGEHWVGLELPRHLTHFTADTLRQMLCAAGFRVKSVRGLVHADWLRLSARRAIASSAGSLGLHLMCWKPVAKVLSWANYALGQAEALVAVAERPD